MFNSMSGDARVRVFASASSWIEGAAVRQLEQLLTRRGVIAVAGMPDHERGLAARALWAFTIEDSTPPVRS